MNKISLLASNIAYLNALILVLLVVGSLIACDRTTVDHITPTEAILSKVNSFKLSENAINSLEKTMDFDDKGRVISFQYDIVRSELGEQEYTQFLQSIFGENMIIHDSNVDSELISDKATSLQSKATFRRMNGGGYNPPGNLFHDKRNWRRPGCKRHTASICVIYL